MIPCSLGPLRFRFESNDSCRAFFRLRRFGRSRYQKPIPGFMETVYPRLDVLIEVEDHVLPVMYASQL